MKKLQFGIMGGDRGSGFAKTLRFMKDAELAALCEIRDEVIQGKIQKHLLPTTRIYKDFDEFIHSGLDAVILCNTFDRHAEYAIKAMELGIAVFSETTAAATLGECVDLVEAVEKYNGKYTLAGNTFFFRAVCGMKNRLETKNPGKVLYAEGEYIHSELVDPEGEKPAIDMNHLHWRQELPPNLYNMHTLGPLMYATDSVPKRVSCKMLVDDRLARRAGKVTDCVGSIVLTEMDNGAIFKTTGCDSRTPTSKWYRIACERETMECERYDEQETKLIVARDIQRGEETDTKHLYMPIIERYEPDIHECGLDAPDINYDDVAQCGHKGIDYFTTYSFIKYLKGEKENYFDVYKAVALSAAGILGWESALHDSKWIDIPDFRDKAVRDRFRGDYRKPFAPRYQDLTMPCRVGGGEPEV